MDHMVFDTRPKRRKAKDNPYELLTTGIETNHPHYYLSFTDSCGMRQFMEINETLFSTFNRFELDDLSQMNKVDRHYEHSEQTEISLNTRATLPQTALEDVVFQQAEIELLYEAIARLPEVQRRRLILYYFCDLTYTKVAELEGCRLESVRQSVKAAVNKLKKWLNNR